MSFLSKHLKVRKFVTRFNHFVEHPLDRAVAFMKAAWAWLWHGLYLAAKYVWTGIVTHRAALWRATLVMVCLVAIVVGIYCGFAIYVERQVTPVPAPDQTVYLGQGWGDGPAADDRDSFYYTPQGALVNEIRYDWMVNVERPWKTDKFASPDYMRGYGFIVDTGASHRNPGGLPVGIAPRYSAKHGEMLIDLTCAGCHTGELEVTANGVRTAVRIDGGSAHHDLTSHKPGRFAGDLSVSLLNTIVNPFKFNRFAAGVLKSENTVSNRFQLWRSVESMIWANLKLIIRERPFYPMEEGFGRTDGLGRIGNAVFAVNLDAGNYRVANAPVSYPVIWEMPWLDWVQYTATVRQPMARNIGEAMGTGAKYYLENPYGLPLPARERFEASTEIANLDSIEHLMRKLKAPCWPEAVFGNIDGDLAATGKDLFYNKFHCVSCHGPHPAPDFVTQSQAPYKLADLNPQGTPDGKNVPHWTVTTLPVQDIGTDPTSAMNFYEIRVNLSKTGMQADEVRTELGTYYRTEYAREVEYDLNLVTILAPDNAKFLTPPPPAPAVLGLGIGVAFDALIQQFNTGRLAFAWHACNGPNAPIPTFASTGFRPATLKALVANPKTDEDIAYMQYMTQYLAEPTKLKTACDALNHRVTQGLEGYLQEKMGDVQLNQVDQGTGLNYLITLVRNRAYENMGISGAGREVERNLEDGYAQLDIPGSGAQYMARPLAGIWATPPFLHNGSVPTLYEMLLPAYQRTKKFYVKGAQFDPRAVGLYVGAREKGAFLYDTSIKGNYDTGHEFRAGYRPRIEGAPPSPQYGAIGPEMTDSERWAIIEYLKIRRDYDDSGDACPESRYLTKPATPTNLASATTPAAKSSAPTPAIPGSATTSAAKPSAVATPGSAAAPATKPSAAATPARATTSPGAKK